MQRVDISQDQHSLDEFANRSASYLGIRLPSEYFEQGRTIAFYKNGRMVGGYCLILQEPFRTLSFVRLHNLEDNLDGVQANQICEGASIWLSDSVQSKLERLQFASTFVLDLHRVGRRYFLIGYNGSCTGLERLYGMADPKRIFQGAVPTATTDTFKDTPTHKSLIIDMVDIRKMPRCFAWYLFRMARKTCRGVRPKYIVNSIKGGRTSVTPLPSAPA